MPPSLPDEIWLDIFHHHVSLLSDVASLASTSHSLRQLGLQRLYLRLNVLRDDVGNTEELRGLPRGLRRISLRLQALQGQKYLLDHVRNFRLRFPRISMYRVSDNELWSSVYNQAIDLLFDLSHIRSLKLEYCPLEPRLLSYISDHTAANTSPLWTTWIAGDVALQLNKQNFFRLEEFTYSSCADQVNLPSFPFLVIQFSPSSLTSLEIEVNHIPDILSLVEFDGLDLTSLLEVRIHLTAYEPSAMILTLLESCHELRCIKVMPPSHLFSAVPDVTILSSNAPNGVLPRLHTIAGTLDVIRALVSGRPVRNVHLFDIPSARTHRADLDILRTSTVPITHLTVQVYGNTPSTEGDFKHLFSTCNALSSLKIFFGVDYYASEYNPASLIHIVMQALPQLPDLQHLLVYIPSKFEKSWDIVRPPTDRHPCLNVLELGSEKSWTEWLSFPGEGWRMKELEGVQVSDFDVHDIYRM